MNDNEFLRKKPKDIENERTFSFFFKIITFVIIISGLWIGAQAFAKSVNYAQEWVGKPMSVIRHPLSGEPYPLYYPWSLLWWMLLFYKKWEVHGYLYSASKIAGFMSLLAIIFYLFVSFVIIRGRAQNIFGTARWGTKRDLEKAGLLGEKGGVILGQLKEARLSYKYNAQSGNVVLDLIRPSQKIVQSGIYNSLLAAPTRSGKGVSSVVPTLLSYPGSVFILDLKGENFDFTSGFRARFGKVYRWAPMGKGHHFNPLMEIRRDQDAFSDANLLADILTTPVTAAASSASEHFITAARDFLTSVILHCLCSDWEDKTFSGCRKFLAQVDPVDSDNNQYIYDLMIKGHHCSSEIHQQIIEGAGNQRKRPYEEGGSVLSTVNNALAIFADNHIKENTANSEFYIDEFEKTDTPISLYVTIPYSEIQRISPLIRMFVTLFSRRFTGGETNAMNIKFKTPILFILDEFDKLGKMEELHTNMGIHNGYGIHYFLIIQAISQLNKLYGKDHSFLAHCRTNLFYAPGPAEIENAETISKICGQESIYKANRSYSGSKGGLLFSNHSLSGNEQGRNLINADEVLRLPSDQLVLLTQDSPPYIAKKNVYYKDPMFTKRYIYGPAFKGREGALKVIGEKPDGPHWFDLPEEGNSPAEQEEAVSEPEQKEDTGYPENSGETGKDDEDPDEDLMEEYGI
ncbi:MAG: type IV secretory system conjugative DNA transfer family protein [Spirochaetaceae bacterium]|nr:type IV secretory system conjugative DNA transfer family protein [Spirochaetaceae bacterium]